MKTITIRLTAPLQSYGNEASFNIRSSYSSPSKSSIIGMVAAALGFRRDETDKIKSLNDLKFAVRIEQQGSMLKEFQTVEYHKNAKTTARKLTYRQFLQDAVFMVALGGDEAQIDQISSALMHPKFQLYLGRRSIPPAGVLKIDKFENQTPVEVLRKLDWQASDWYKKKYQSNTYHTHIIGDADLFDTQNSHLVKDAFGSFDFRNRYHNYRPVSVEMIELANSENSDENQDDFDFWKFI